MPKTKQQKEEILAQLNSALDKQSALIVIDYKGLHVGEMSQLRAQLKQVGAQLVVVKKTLFSKALKEKGIQLDLKSMDGQLAAVFAVEDSIASMKAVHTFGKTNEHVKILGGYFEDEIQSADNIVAIALLPSREELLAKLVGTMAAPMSGFATVLQGNIKGLVVALQGIAQK